MNSLARFFKRFISMILNRRKYSKKSFDFKRTENTSISQPVTVSTFENLGYRVV